MKKLLSKKIHFPLIQAQPCQIKKGFFSKIKRFLSFRRLWKTTQDYYCWSEYLGKFIFIPAIFLFDGASVPKLLYSIFSPMGLLLYGALPHDFGYRFKGLFIFNQNKQVVEFQEFDKKELDKIFCELNIQENGMKKSSKTATFSLKAGIFTWKNYRKVNENVFDAFPYLKG